MRPWLLSLVALLTATPAIAENWMYAGIESSGKVISVEATSIRRTLKDFSRISYQVRVESVEETMQAKVSGNCSTGSWRVAGLKRSSKSSQSDKALMLPQDAGDRSLHLACSMRSRFTKNPSLPINRPLIPKKAAQQIQPEIGKRL